MSGKKLARKVFALTLRITFATHIYNFLFGRIGRMNKELL